jgi:cold shock protein
MAAFGVSAPAGFRTAVTGIPRQSLEPEGPKNKKEFQVKENGVVKWFNGAKGYGFIQRSSGEDVFVHFSAIQDSGYRTLNEGEAVEFECQQGPKGLSAANVIRASA